MQTVALIVIHVPTWVWGILAFVIVMGLLQSRDQQMARTRVLIVPLVWLGFGAWGVEQSFGLAALPLLAWGLGLAASLQLVRRSGWPGRVAFDAATNRFFVPGSWAPMALMMTIFVAKFALGMSLGMRPALAGSAVFAAGFSALFGALSGVFLGRSRNILASAAAPRAVLGAA